jgi:FkbM family methyltransferase
MFRLNTIFLRSLHAMKKKGLGYYLKKLSLRWQRRVDVGPYALHIPAGHSLPLFTTYYPHYDRFLPLLAAQVPANETIVDVGANIGDSLFAMLPHHKGPYVLVEGSPFFLNFLARNLDLLDAETRQSISLAPLLAGTGSLTGDLSHTDARTATRVTSQTPSIPTQTLDEILESKGKIGLLKADTDGFDWDVLLSAQGVLARDQPLLFWENEVFENEQREGYLQLYDKLFALGYNHFAVFDNYGVLMLETDNPKALATLCDYLLLMNKGKATRTFFYVDVLAYTDTRADIAQKALQKYKTSLS